MTITTTIIITLTSAHTLALPLCPSTSSYIRFYLFFFLYVREFILYSINVRIGANSLQYNTSEENTSLYVHYTREERDISIRVDVTGLELILRRLFRSIPAYYFYCVCTRARPAAALLPPRRRIRYYYYVYIGTLFLKMIEKKEPIR